MADYMKVAKKTVAVVLAIQATLFAEAAAVYAANYCYEAYLEAQANTEVYNVDPGKLKTTSEAYTRGVKACGDVYNGPETRAEQISITACQQAIFDVSEYVYKAKTEGRKAFANWSEMEVYLREVLKNTVDDRTKYTMKYLGHSVNPFAQIGAEAIKEHYKQGYMQGLVKLFEATQEVVKEKARKG